ncbi:unnamed protein product [Sphagnum troendelagicum]|uniref:C-CAP/cofactor C-like domain-containing protein n=1 Tax=Sphagnum troendelagicum TaxID=128251 RepID=A0ABP0TSL6_9BRYO
MDPNQNPSQAYKKRHFRAAALEKKRAVMEERLQSHYDSYLRDSTIRKSQTAAIADPRESLDAFLAVFSQRREEICVCFAEKKAALLSSPNVEDVASLKVELESLLLEVGKLQKLVADSSFYLPTYTMQSAQATVTKLKEEVETAMSDLLPKRKFSFRGKSTTTKRASFQGIQDEQNAVVNNSFQGIQDKQDAVVNNSSQGIQDKQDDAVNPSFQGIQDMQDAVLVRDAKDLEEDREFRLSNLSNCRVYLQGKFTTLYVNKLRNCHVYAGPVTGSVLIEEVQGSLFMLASHQIRIHSTTATDFYLRVRSRPIVEYTKGIRFAPYAFHYSGIEKDLQAANLMEETDLWESVDDFRWLRAVQSPNWSVLPSDQRISMEGPPQLEPENGP